MRKVALFYLLILDGIPLAKVLIQRNTRAFEAGRRCWNYLNQTRNYERQLIPGIASQRDPPFIDKPERSPSRYSLSVDVQRLSFLCFLPLIIIPLAQELWVFINSTSGYFESTYRNNERKKAVLWIKSYSIDGKESRS